jgi:branched-chain amino acid transport system permease protein
MDAVMALTDRHLRVRPGAMLAEGAPREVMQSPA